MAYIGSCNCYRIHTNAVAEGQDNKKLVVAVVVERRTTVVAAAASNYQ